MYNNRYLKMAENATSETEADLEDSTPDSVDPTTESIDVNIIIAHLTSFS